MKWGTAEFGPSPDDHIGLMGLKITNAVATQNNSTTEGNAQTNVRGREPQQVTFSIMYVLKHTDQTLESLARYWYNRVGEVHWMIWGSDRAPNLTPYPMMLKSAPFTIEHMHGGGTLASLKIDFTFESVMEDWGKEEANRSVADYVPG